MEIMLIITLIISGLVLLICILALIYYSYQLKRNDEVYNIQVHWINTYDKRHIQYDYDYMFEPNKSNWYGLKWPRDKDYK